MRTVIQTKIYEIRQSSKGWSGIYALYFNKERAIERCNNLNIEAKNDKRKTNYRVYEHTAGDILIYNAI